LSGAFCLCVGRPRFSVEDRPEERLGTFCLDIMVGIGQLFTVLFCLVGWGWSIWWGTIMVKLASKYTFIAFFVYLTMSYSCLPFFFLFCSLKKLL